MENAYLTPEQRRQVEQETVARILAEAEAQEHQALIVYQAKRAYREMLEQRMTGKFPEPPEEDALAPAAASFRQSAEERVGAKGTG